MFDWGGGKMKEISLWYTEFEWLFEWVWIELGGDASRQLKIQCALK